MASRSVEGFLGGPWQRVLLKLVILSVIVGFIMVTFGIDPDELVHTAIESTRRLLNMIAFRGLDTLLTFGRYCLYGAVIVIPIWLIVRLLAATRRP
jgi:hypothetical protein